MSYLQSMMLFLFSLVLVIGLPVCAQKKYYLLLGTYTSGKSTGMYVYDFDPMEGSARVIDSVQTPNPSYVAVAPNQKFVYAVSETQRGNYSGKVRSFLFDKKTPP